MALCGIGFGFFQTPNNATIMTAGPQNRAGAAGGMLAVARTLGWCVGSALVTLIFSLSHGNATVLCLQVACGFTLAGAIASVLARRLPAPAVVAGHNWLASQITRSSYPRSYFYPPWGRGLVKGAWPQPWPEFTVAKSE